MEYLRSSVNLRAYGQRDPLVEYKKEGLRLFETMEAAYETNVMERLPQVLGAGSVAPVTPSAILNQKAAENVQKAAQAITHQNTVAKKYGRNDKVKITDGTVTEEMKFKKAERLLETGKWRIIEG
jgi:preprotein translocase subunit SecA